MKWSEISSLSLKPAQGCHEAAGSWCECIWVRMKNSADASVGNQWSKTRPRTLLSVRVLWLVSADNRSGHVCTDSAVISTNVNLILYQWALTQRCESAVTLWILLKLSRWASHGHISSQNHNCYVFVIPIHENCVYEAGNVYCILSVVIMHNKSTSIYLLLSNLISLISFYF